MNKNGARVSVYRSAFDTIPSVDVGIGEYLEKVKQGWTKYQDTIQEIHALDPLKSEQEKKNYEALKKTLPCCTISGTFKSGRKDKDLKDHSGHLAIDIDRKKDINKILLQKGGLQKVIELLKREPWVYSIFKSVGGRSLCCVVNIP